jgi:hypothetical protein
MVELFLLSLLTGSIVALICLNTVLFRWEYAGNKGGQYTLLWIFYFFGFLISFIWLSSDRKYRGLYNLVEGWGVDRWHIVTGIVLVSLVSVGIFRIYCGEKDETLGE